MDDKKIESPGFGDEHTVPLAYHELCMTRNHRVVLRLLLAWAVSVVCAVLIFAYMWLQYDYVSTTEYEGVYNVTDSEGNVISSDLSPEDIIEIVEVLDFGAGAED